MHGRSLKLALAGLALACAARPPSQPVPRKSAESAQRPTVTWSYHPGPARFSLSSLPVEGGVLHVTDAGERWVVGSDGRATPSLAFAGDVLSNVVRSGSGYVFVTPTGVGHFARTPLGPFEATWLPSEDTVKVRLGGEAVFALLADGSLMRSPLERWHFTPAVKGTRIADLGLDGANVLAILVPETLQSSSDSGASWRRVDVEPFGAFAVQRKAGGGLEVVGAGGRRAWDAQAGVLGPLDRSRHEPQPMRAESIVPDASAFDVGHAVISGDRYLEIRHERRWQIVEGTIEGPFTVAPLPERVAGADLGACGDLALGAHGRFVSLACVEHNAVRLLDSSDGGRTFASALRIDRPGEPPSAVSPASPPPTIPAPAPRRLQLPVRGGRLKLPKQPKRAPSDPFRPWPASPAIVAGRDGGVVMQPRCAFQSANCWPDRVLLRRAHGANLEEWPMAPLEQVGGVTFSLDGSTAYALTCERWRNELYLRRADMASKTFGLTRVETVARACDVVEQLRAMSPTEDGRVALLHGRQVPISRVVSVDGLSDLSPVKLEPSASYAMAGLLGLRVSANGELAETLDAGAHFRSVTQLGFPICPDSLCSIPIVCARAGCLVGNSLTRKGWGADEAPPTSRPVAARVGRRSPEGPRPSWAGVIRCVTGDPTWAETPAVPGPSSFGTKQNAWLAVVRTSATEASVVRGLDAPRLHVSSSPLFAKATAKAAPPSLWTEENELGAGAMRYERLATGAEAMSLAWASADSTQIKRQQLRLPAPFPPRTRPKDPSARIQLAAGGVYVHWWADTLFADGRGSHEVPGAGGGAIVRIQGRDLGIGAEPSLLHTLLPGASNPVSRFMSVGAVGGPDFGVASSLVSWGGRPGFAVAYARPSPVALFFPVLPSGEIAQAEGLPMPPPAPIACDPRQRASTPRRPVAIDYQIVVTGPDELESVYRGTGMLQGTADHPCVTFVVAQNAGDPTVRRLFIDLSAPGRAWQFDHGKRPMHMYHRYSDEPESKAPPRFRSLRCELPT